MKLSYSFLAFIFILIACAAPDQRVEIIKSGNKYALKRHGSPYFINGAVGLQNLKQLGESGANSVRIWNNYNENLAKADSMGLSVLVSLPVKAERDGFDYSDETTVKQQKEDILKLVRLMQFHPSILMWAVGNELDFIPGSKPYYTSMWDAIDDIAREIKLIDPDHPVMTVIGTNRFEKVSEIVNRCPDIDLLGINAYGDMAQIPELLHKYGWDKPYVFTEWGVSGYWEVPKTEWGAPFEENSAKKAELYDYKYHSVILADSGQCLGSYVFLWGRKQETTPTWFGMFDETGNASEAVNVMKECWGGGVVTNHAPVIDSIRLAGKSYFSSVYLTPGEVDTAAIFASDPEKDSLTINWEVRPEAAYAPYAGQGEQTPPVIPGSIMENNKKMITFKAPANTGAYRIYVFLYDSQNHFSTANFPFYVR